MPDTDGIRYDAGDGHVIDNDPPDILPVAAIEPLVVILPVYVMLHFEVQVSKAV